MYDGTWEQSVEKSPKRIIDMREERTRGRREKTREKHASVPFGGYTGRDTRRY